MLFDHRKLLRNDGVVEWRLRELFVCFINRQLGFWNNEVCFDFLKRNAVWYEGGGDQKFRDMGWENIW